MDLSTAPRLSPARGVTTADWLGFAAAAVVALGLVWLNPVGYIGAGADDEHYLSAARCWRELGAPCLPESHWWARWAAVAPAAVSTALLGEYRWTLGIGPFAYCLLALAAGATTATLWFGARAGALAMALFAAVPAFTASALGPNVDIPEVAFQLCALAAATLAFQRQSRRCAVAAGAFAGLAVLARETSFVFLAVSAAAWFFLDSRRRIVLLWSIGGLAAVVAAEMAVYAVATGDPLLRWTLALSHTTVPSNALPSGFDTSDSPLFNPAYIAAWKREAGIELWWAIDPWLNLLASPRIQALLWVTPVALVAFRDRLPSRARASIKRILVFAGLYAALLVYGLAVDPKSRMFLLPAAGLAMASAALIVAGWRSRSQLLATVLALAIILYGAATLNSYFAGRSAEQRAAQWLTVHAANSEIDEGARSYLTLLPEARALPTRGSGRRFVILLNASECGGLIRADDNGRPNGRVVEEVGGAAATLGRLCLLEYLPRRA